MEMRILTAVLLAAVTLVSVQGKPAITGSNILYGTLNQNISVECRGNESVTWYRLESGEDLLANPTDVSLMNFYIQRVSKLDLYGDTEFKDFSDHFPEKHIAVMEITQTSHRDEGLYVCVHELGTKKVRRKLKKLNDKHFTPFLIVMNVSIPFIEEGNTLSVNAGGNINITCRGEKPVSWVALNNFTQATQHTDKTSKNDVHISVLEIINVNYTDVGFYVCIFSDHVDILYDDHDHEKDKTAASTYLFVKDETHLLAMKGQVHFFYSEIKKTLIIPCKPTFPEVKVTLTNMIGVMSKAVYEYRKGFYIDTASKRHHEGLWWCHGRYEDHEEEEMIQIEVLHYRPNIPVPRLDLGGFWQKNLKEKDTKSYIAIAGANNLVLNCSEADLKPGEEIVWLMPDGVNKTGSQHIYRLYYNTQSRNFTNLSTEDAGVYGCYIRSSSIVNSTANHISLTVLAANSPYLVMEAQKKEVQLNKEEREDIMWIVHFNAYPQLILKWSYQGHTIMEVSPDTHEKMTAHENGRYSMLISWLEGEIKLKLKQPTFMDVGEYKLEGFNRNLQEDVSLLFIMRGEPEETKLEVYPTNHLVKDKTLIQIDCIGYGHPLPELQLLFRECFSGFDCESNFTLVNIMPKNEEIHVIENNTTSVTAKRVTSWQGVAITQGDYLCVSKNQHGAHFSHPLLLSISDSYVKNPNELQLEVTREDVVERHLPTNDYITVNAVEGDRVLITCRGSNAFVVPPLTWSIGRGDGDVSLNSSDCTTLEGINICPEVSETKYSITSTISAKITTDFDGVFFNCSDSSLQKISSSLHLAIRESSAPKWTSAPLGKLFYNKEEKQKISLHCSADGLPEPKVSWIKNDATVMEDDSDSGVSMVNGNLTIAFLYQKDSGKYTCVAENRVGRIEDWITLQVKDMDATSDELLIIIIGTVSAVLFVIIIAFSIKLYYDRRRSLRIKREIQLMFERGNPESLNPELDLGEQADLLPYDKKFEFPRRNVIFEKLLGSGEFGNVFKATTINLVAGESKTTVAVKTIKSQASEAHMKSLRTELKIMIHIGRHINIVNLLGACSKDLATKGELLLIVEYCRHGNILEYMRQHKNSFINQINEFGKVNPCLHHDRRNRLSRLSSQFKMNYAQLEMRNPQSPFRYSRESEVTGSVRNSTYSPGSICESRTNDDSSDVFTFVSEPHTPIDVTDNYVSELERRGPLSTLDLLHWAYQIANGMFYLSERKVIHGDLAARNILLSDKNVVKISDFGLAKNIYKNTQYKKRTNAPVPVKWVAIEALREGIYSTQSDVWSYGVVLWEVFSLGKNPYPGIEYDDSFIKKLENGLRLPKPDFSTNELYYIMDSCWKQDPNERMSFKHLEKKLGDMLGETERQEYLKLNEEYNEGAENDASDLLQRIRTPSYTTRVKDFFFDGDAYGYERPIIVCGSDIAEVAMLNMEPFPLQPVPKKRRPGTLSIEINNSPSNYNSTEGEADSGTCYIPMASPNESHQAIVSNENTAPFVDSPTSVTSDYLCMQTVKESTVQGGKDAPNYCNVNNTASVHSSEKNHVDPECKRDSGLYSPCSTLQVNPQYVYASEVEAPKSYFIPESDSHHKFSKMFRNRTQSDSSSGISISSESSNSMDNKKQGKIFPAVPLIQEENDKTRYLNSRNQEAIV